MSDSKTNPNPIITFFVPEGQNPEAKHTQRQLQLKRDDRVTLSLLLGEGDKPIETSKNNPAHIRVKGSKEEATIVFASGAWHSRQNDPVAKKFIDFLHEKRVPLAVQVLSVTRGPATAASPATEENMEDCPL